MDVKTISIDKIGLSRRSSNALHRVGIGTVGEMLEYTEDMLSEIRNLGRKSIDEILLKIDEYRNFDSDGCLFDVEIPKEVTTPDNFEVWCDTEEGRTVIIEWLLENDVTIGDLEFLSAKAYNLLLLNNIKNLDKIVFLSVDKLMEIPNMDSSSAEEIVKVCRHYVKYHEAEIIDDLKKKEASGTESPSYQSSLYSRKGHDRVVQYVQANDCDVEKINFSNRSKRVLLRNGLHKISDFIFVTENEMGQLKGMGTGSLQEIQTFIDDYLAKHGDRIKAFCGGDYSVIWDSEVVKNIIMETYNKKGFEGLSLHELREESAMPEHVSDELLKSVVGALLAEGTLEYVDFRCYRVYPHFVDYLLTCSGINDRNRDIIRRRLQGETLERIAASYEMTRERVRQIINRDIKIVKDYFYSETGMEWFDEDYYRYFYETYAFDKKDAGSWLGISKDVFNYLELTGAERGDRDLEEAIGDYHHLDYGFRLKIKNYLNRNKLFLDGKWIEKSRSKLEEFVVKKYCQETVSFTEFTRIYNSFLREEEVAYDENIYFTEAVERTRKNRLSEARFLLWKYGEQIRYYDIDGRDYTELWDSLNLDAYENIEYSTEKFIIDYPEIMEKYDIRDQYELHNLLRKTVSEGSYHDFHCNRTPMIEFGKFDRDSALLDLLIDNAPISQTDLLELVHQEYGYDPATTLGSYLQPLGAYYHQGMYTIDQKVMTTRHMEALGEVLKDDFYYIDEVRRLYDSLSPDTDPEEINPYNLKRMGFYILSRYIYRNHSSLEAYFRSILTQDDIIDITPYRRRFVYVQSFSSTLIEMKSKMEILEFEPNQIISFRKLEEAGITKADMHFFCTEVYEYVEDDTYFSIQSIKKEGFKSELFDLGFSDWFYASLLAADERFAYSTMFGNIILYKGDERITIKSFEETLIKEHRSVDVYDLMTEMEETYGCRIPDRLDLIYKVNGTDVYYDKYMDRLYANTGIFNRELDETERL